MHYQRYRTKGDPGEPSPRYLERMPGAACVVDGCDGVRRVRGMCGMHYARWRVRGEAGSAASLQRKRGRNPKSTRLVNAQGYVEIKVPAHPCAKANGWALEHRVVMADSLGRALLPHESAHHINGRRDDNRIENLELWSSHQPPGQRVADKVAWAREILSLYAEN